MGLLKKLFGIGVTAGATVAAVRVSDRVKANNPDGVPDINGDGKVDAKDLFSEVKRAAGEVYAETAASIKEKREQKNPYAGPQAAPAEPQAAPDAPTDQVEP